ncbi:MAG TPA: hypothetical protein VLU95_05695, partial [Candidatus Acidoferrum sp.]|nr:hypothetical protein [Candidatus Acidoferrum sp.]
TATPTPTNSPTPTIEPTPTPSPTPTDSPIPTATPFLIVTPTPKVIYTPNPTLTPAPTPSPSPISKPKIQLIQATETNGPDTNLSVYGNISYGEVSGAVIQGDVISATTNVTLTFNGLDEPNIFCNVTIPKNVVLPDITKVIVYVNNQLTEYQGFTHDTQNFYVWFTSILKNTYEVTIVFTRNPESWVSIPIVIISIILVVIIILPKIKPHNKF